VPRLNKVRHPAAQIQRVVKRLGLVVQAQR
jgi:hypothetical protein